MLCSQSSNVYNFYLASIYFIRRKTIRSYNNQFRKMSIMKNRKVQPFTTAELYLVIDQTLGMFGYYKHLILVLQEIRENQIDKVNLKFEEQTFNLEIISEALNSKAFLEKVYPYMNSMLTSTNIGIVIQSLKVYCTLPNKKLRYQALQRIKETVNIFMMHQMQKNITSLLCDLQYLNEVFAKVGLIISQQEFAYYCSRIWKKESPVKGENQLVGEIRNSKVCTQQDYWLKKSTLQIYELLPLSIEIQTIDEYKRQLLLWLSSPQHDKKLKAKERNREKNNKKNSQFPLQSIKGLESINAKKISKIKVKFIKSEELLRQIKQKQLIIKKSILSKTYREVCIEHDNNQDQQVSEFYHNFQSSDKLQKKSKKMMLDTTLNLNSSWLFQTKDNRQSLETQQMAKKRLNGRLIQDEIETQLRNGQAIVIQNFTPDLLINSSPTYSTKNLVKKISQEVMTTEFLSGHRKVINEPFFRIAQKIFR